MVSATKVQMMIQKSGSLIKDQKLDPSNLWGQTKS